MTDGPQPSSDDERGLSTFGALVVAAVLLAVPLAGCAGPGAGNGDGGGGPDAAAGDPFKARAQLSTAEEIAEGWSSDATLIGISTIESDQKPDNWTQDGFEFTPDRTIGDGLSPQWVYFFQNGDGEKLGVGVNADGETYENTDARPQSPGGTLETWSVDSAAAVDAAKSNETFSSVLEAEDAEVLYFLAGPAQQGQAPNWLLKASSDARGEEQTVFVNAQTGETRTFGG